MKKNILLLLTSLLLSVVTDAQAQKSCDKGSCCVKKTNLYAKIFGGANFLQNSTVDGNKSTYESGYLVAGSLGYSWRYGLHVEAEYAFRRNAIRKIHFFDEGHSKQGNFHASSYMVNLLWDLPYCCTFWNIHPFIGAGIGCDSQRMHSSNSRIVFSQKWNHFSWQAMAGLAYPLFCNTLMTLEYKFHQGGCHFNNHAIGVGLVYNFDRLR